MEDKNRSSPHSSWFFGLQVVNSNVQIAAPSDGSSWSYNWSPLKFRTSHFVGNQDITLEFSSKADEKREMPEAEVERPPFPPSEIEGGPEWLRRAFQHTKVSQSPRKSQEGRDLTDGTHPPFLPAGSSTYEYVSVPSVLKEFGESASPPIRFQ